MRPRPGRPRQARRGAPCAAAELPTDAENSAHLRQCRTAALHAPRHPTVRAALHCRRAQQGPCGASAPPRPPACSRNTKAGQSHLGCGQLKRATQRAAPHRSQVGSQKVHHHEEAAPWTFICLRNRIDDSLVVDTDVWGGAIAAVVGGWLAGPARIGATENVAPCPPVYRLIACQLVACRAACPA